jgi:hypothetical protein
VLCDDSKRGTIYGVYDLSEQIGVSPWAWWADVRIQHRDELFIKNEPYVRKSPTVKYRGFFLNDEQPALTSESSDPSFAPWGLAKSGALMPILRLVF